MPKTGTIKHTFDLVREVKNNLPGACAATYIEALTWVLCKLDITRFAYVYTDTHSIDNGELSIQTNYPTEWVDTYRRQALYKCDPVMANSAITSRPFFWKSLNERTADERHKIFEQSAR